MTIQRLNTGRSATFSESGGLGASVVPATLVVASDRGDYPLTDQGIRDAITALNAAGGGTLFIGADGGTPIDINSDLPEITTPCRILGAGRNVTRLNLAVADIKLFKINDVYTYFEDFTILGDNGASDQVFITFTAAAADFFTQCNVTRVNANTSPFGLTTKRIMTAFDFDNIARYVNIKDSYFGVGNGVSTINSFLFKDAAASQIKCDNLWSTIGAGISSASTPTISMTNCLIFAQSATAGWDIKGGTYINTSILGATAISGTSTFISCSINATINITSTVYFVGGSIGAVTVAEFGRLVASGTAFQNITLNGSDGNVINGCFSAVSATITVNDSNDNIITDNYDITVVETGSSDNNYYTKIGSASTIIGPNSEVNGSKAFYITNEATTNTFVDQFTYTNPKGLFGTGTLINTGSETLVIEETVEDLFGNTAVVTNEVPAGDDIALDLQIKFEESPTAGIAYPPISTYTLAVKDQGIATTFSIRFTVRGSM